MFKTKFAGFVATHGKMPSLKLLHGTSAVVYGGCGADNFPSIATGHSSMEGPQSLIWSCTDSSLCVKCLAQQVKERLCLSSKTVQVWMLDIVLWNARALRKASFCSLTSNYTFKLLYMHVLSPMHILTNTCKKYKSYPSLKLRGTTNVVGIPEAFQRPEL